MAHTARKGTLGSTRDDEAAQAGTVRRSLTRLIGTRPSALLAALSRSATHRPFTNMSASGADAAAATDASAAAAANAVASTGQQLFSAGPLSAQALLFGSGAAVELAAEAKSSYERALNLITQRASGQKVDAGEIVRLLRPAAEAGLLDAQQRLGLRYATGDGVAADQTEARRWWTSAAEKGNASAQDNLAQMLEKSGEVQDALKWYEAAAKQGYPSAQYNLGQGLWMGRLLQPADSTGANAQALTAARQRALELWQAAADADFPLALLRLGGAYEEGAPRDTPTLAIAQDLKKTFECYKRAAMLGHPAAMSLLAACYMRGKGCAVDWPAALRIWERQAAQGDIDAAFNAAQTYLKGDKPGVSQDVPKGVALMERAAELGDPEAPLIAAEWYMRAGDADDNGERAPSAGEPAKDCVPADWPKVVRLLRLAAERHGHGEAAYQCALIYAFGKPPAVPADGQRTLEMFRMAAARGHPEGCLRFGKALLHGNGVRKDEAQAMRFLTQAAKAGVDEAKQILQQIKGKARK